MIDTHPVDDLLLRLLLELRDVVPEILRRRREPRKHRHPLRRDHREDGLAERLLGVERLLDLWQQVRRAARRALHEVRLLGCEPLVLERLRCCRPRCRVDREALRHEALRRVRNVRPVLLCGLRQALFYMVQGSEEEDAPGSKW